LRVGGIRRRRRPQRGDKRLRRRLGCTLGEREEQKNDSVQPPPLSTARTLVTFVFIGTALNVPLDLVAERQSEILTKTSSTEIGTTAAPGRDLRVDQLARRHALRCP